MKKFALLLAAMLFLSGCLNTDSSKRLEPDSGQTAKPVQKEELPANEKLPAGLSAWITYWDLGQAEEELLLLQDGLSSLSYFEAYFNGQYQVVIPEGFLEACEEMEGKPETIWLTVVNDVVYEENRENSLKDTEVLRTLFASPKLLKNHVEELVELAKESGVDGIEIDYENIRKDMKLWKGFESFANKLAKRLKQEGLGLRIVLETQTPFEKLTLPKDAEYVIMCYNLHGMANDIGAKADKKFLKKTVQDASVLPGTPVFALSTGGFDWWNQGAKVQAVTEQQAVALQKDYGATEVIRDKKSHALHFQYKDNSGKQHEVWYADGETIVQWIDWVCEKQEYPIAIWRLGGNTPESVERWQK